MAYNHTHTHMVHKALCSAGATDVRVCVCVCVRVCVYFTQTINAATSTGLTKLRTVLSSLTSHHSVLLGVLYACTAGAASQYYSAAQPGPTKDQQAALRKARNASNKRGAGACVCVCVCVYSTCASTRICGHLTQA